MLQRRNWLFVCAFILSLSLGMGMRLLAIRSTDQTSVIGYPLIDDSYYYFTLGRHLALGDGARVDSFHLTTGFQPLWGLLNTIPFVFFPNALNTAISAIQIIGALIGLITAVPIYEIGKRLSGSKWIALFVMSLWWLAPQSMLYNLNGMETSLALLATMLLLLFAVIRLQTRTMTLRDAAIFGLLTGFGFLCRIDTPILAAIVFIAIWFTAPPNHITDAVKRVAVIGCCAGIIISPWTLFALSIGKSPMPESGSAVRLLATFQRQDHAPIPINVNDYLYRRANGIEFMGVLGLDFIVKGSEITFALAPLQWIKNFIGESFATSLSRLLGLLLITLGMRIAVRRQSDKRIVRVWAIYCAMMLAAYAFYIVANWFLKRYTLPVWDSLSILAFAFMFTALAKRLASKPRLLAMVFGGIGLLYAATYVNQLAVNNNYNWIFYGIDERLHPIDLYDAAQWLNAHVQLGETVGTFQSGVLGYYNQYSVYNLDGKVNSDAQDALAQGTIWQYMCASKITYVVDQRYLIQKFLEYRTINWNPHNLSLLHVIDTNTGRIGDRVEIYRLQCPSAMVMR